MRGQHPRGVPGGELPRLDPGSPGSSSRNAAHLVQGDGDAVGVDEQVVLGEEPGEEHPVPVLVGALGDEVVELLPVVAAERVAQLAAPGAEGDAQLSLIHREGPGRLGGVDSECPEGLLGPLLGDAPGLEDDGAETVAKVGMETRHAHSVPDRTWEGRCEPGERPG